MEKILEREFELRKISTYLLVLWITIGPTGIALAEIPEVCSREPNPIVVTVHGVRSDKGTLKAKLYGDNPDDFLRKGKKIDSHRVSAKKNTTVLCLYVPQPGMYAIAVHHDENGNKKLDLNWFGMPSEGFGFSNNPSVFLASPDPEDAAFQVENGRTTIDINLRY